MRAPPSPSSRQLLLLTAGVVAGLMITGTLAQSQSAGSLPGVGTPKVVQLHTNVVAVLGLYHPAGKSGVNAGVVATPQSLVFVDAGMSVPSGEFMWSRTRTSLLTAR